MTLILIEKGLVSEGSTPKIEDKQVPGSWLDKLHMVAVDMVPLKGGIGII